MLGKKHWAGVGKEGGSCGVKGQEGRAWVVDKE